MMQPNTMNEGDLVRFKKDRIGLAENGETIGIIINIITLVITALSRSY